MSRRGQSVTIMLVLTLSAVHAAYYAPVSNTTAWKEVFLANVDVNGFQWTANCQLCEVFLHDAYVVAFMALASGKEKILIHVYPYCPYQLSDVGGNVSLLSVPPICVRPWSIFAVRAALLEAVTERLLAVQRANVTVFTLVR